MATMRLRIKDIPKDHPVLPLRKGQKARDRCFCGECGLSWDDGVCTSMTPTPGGRCPFEAFHVEGKVRYRSSPRPCRECGEEGEHHFSCSSVDAKCTHEPDPASITPDDRAGRGRGTDWIIDASCKKCGKSGSMQIDPATFQFD